jgi:hypothetical protein
MSFIFFGSKKNEKKKLLQKKNDLRLTAPTFFCGLVFAALIVFDAAPLFCGCVSISKKNRNFGGNCGAKIRRKVAHKGLLQGLVNFYYLFLSIDIEMFNSENILLISSISLL